MLSGRLVLHAGRVLVFVQIGLEREGFSAAGTRVGLRVRVRLDVRSQVRLVRKRLLADVTLERLLTCVRPDVTLEQPRAREALAAGRTLAALVVRAHVHRVRRHRDVHLGAVRATAGLLVLERSMCLPMPGQIRRSRVLLSTLRTPEHVIR